jgi:hypothetical protein
MQLADALADAQIDSFSVAEEFFAPPTARRRTVRDDMVELDEQLATGYATRRRPTSSLPMRQRSWNVGGVATIDLYDELDDMSMRPTATSWATRRRWSTASAYGGMMRSLDQSCSATAQLDGADRSRVGVGFMVGAAGSGTTASGLRCWSAARHRTDIMRC